MKLFKQEIDRSKPQYQVRESFAAVPKENVEEIRALYEKSLTESYWRLWTENPYKFAKDIQLYDNDPRLSIQKYSKDIADRAIKEWMENNLTSVIAYQGIGSNRKIVGVSLFGVDREVKSKHEQPFYFYYLGILPTHFRWGIGTELVEQTLKHCQAKAKQNNQSCNVKLHTRVFNTPAINLYEKFGFTPVAGDVTHGHSNKYVCYINHIKPEQEITRKRTVTLAK